MPTGLSGSTRCASPTETGGPFRTVAHCMIVRIRVAVGIALAAFVGRISCYIVEGVVAAPGHEPAIW